ncbi:MAG: hypothetical protein R3353_04190 [Salegentibacter mishustinae]|nr:hypothetical protein [Salegentibacter mishustinae]
MHLKNKNILFSCDGIEGFKENIMHALLKNFNYVEYIDSDMPEKKERSLSFKIIRELQRKTNLKFIKNSFNEKLEIHHKKIIKNLISKYDYFFVIAGKEFSSNFIKKLKKENPDLKCVLFLWDKFENTSLKSSASEFDYIFTFDREDAKNYGFIFRPSFFLDACQNKVIVWNERLYSMFYIGALRSKERYEKVSSIYHSIQDDKLKINSFIKLLCNKKNKQFIPKKYNETLITNKKIAYLDTLEMTRKSRVILDLPHENQIGLTLRVFEALATRTKIITTNKDILNYDFFHPENILVIDNSTQKIDNDFFERPYKKIPKNIIDKYSTNGFILDIFSKIEQ